MNDLSDFQRRRAGQQGVDLRAIDWDATRKVFRWGLVILALIILWNVARRLGTFYTDWLWFRELGHEAVLVKIVLTGGVLFAIGTVVFVAAALPSVYATARSSKRAPLPQSPLEVSDYLRIHRFLRRGATAVAGFAALVLGSYAASNWETVLLALNAAPFGESDPIFGRDFSFYIFTLPALRFLHGWLVAATVAIGVMVLVFHNVTGRLGKKVAGRPRGGALPAHRGRSLARALRAAVLPHRDGVRRRLDGRSHQPPRPHDPGRGRRGDGWHPGLLRHPLPRLQVDGVAGGGLARARDPGGVRGPGARAAPARGAERAGPGA
jgi:hypothetical protein